MIKHGIILHTIHTLWHNNNDDNNNDNDDNNDDDNDKIIHGIISCNINSLWYINNKALYDITYHVSAVVKWQQTHYNILYNMIIQQS